MRTYCCDASSEVSQLETGGRSSGLNWRRSINSAYLNPKLSGSQSRANSSVCFETRRLSLSSRLPSAQFDIRQCNRSIAVFDDISDRSATRSARVGSRRVSALASP